MRKISGKHILAGVVVWLALGVAAPARTQVCETYCSNYSEGQCSAHETKCTNPEPPRPSYGAIAYGRKSGAYGFSYKWDSKSNAESVAMQNCAKRGSDCEVMVWFDRRCGAVAARENGTTAYWGLGDGRRRGANPSHAPMHKRRRQELRSEGFAVLAVSGPPNLSTYSFFGFRPFLITWCSVAKPAFKWVNRDSDD